MIRSLCLLFMFITTTSLHAQSFREKINDGNALYKKEQFDDALNKYKDALLDDPRSEVAHFNEGAALYKIQKYDQAIESLQKIIGSKDLTLEEQAQFNIGNAYFKQDKLQESIQAYKKALDIDPNDQDAKYNLELARAKLKEMAEKQPMQQQPQSQQQQQDQGENQQDQKPQQDQQNEEQQQQQQQQQDQSAVDNKEKISKEDAERILDALKNQEKEKQKLRRAAQTAKRQVEKDW